MNENKYDKGFVMLRVFLSSEDEHVFRVLSGILFIIYFHNF